MVRGSAIRVTALDDRGRVGDPIQYGVSKSVARVRIDEVVEQARSEILSTPEEERRLRFDRSAQTIRYRANIEFLRVDPSVLSLVAGVELVYSASSSGGGFGEGEFGMMPFGGGSSSESSDVVGFDSTTRLPATSFALEVWSKLAGQRCADGAPAWGYTLFPYLRGGRLSGFQFANGLVSFNLIGAQTRRSSQWGVGPYDLEGPFERLVHSVSRNTTFHAFMTSATPPTEACGVQEVTDVLDNGTASNPMPDPAALFIVDGGGAETSAFIIDGGRA
jgi:hypothetical protein